MAKSRRQQLEERAARLGLTVEMWSPGDGKTRYSFNVRDPNGSSAYAIGCALGIADAETWLDGATALYDLEHYDVASGTERGPPTRARPKEAQRDITHESTKFQDQGQSRRGSGPIERLARPPRENAAIRRQHPLGSRV